MGGHTSPAVLGGIEGIGKITAAFVPLMIVIYVGGGITALVLMADRMPEAIATIFSNAFTGTAATGGFVGSGIMLAIQFGVARGIHLVAIAFIVYDRVMSTQRIAQVDNSRSAQVFQQMSGRLNQQIPQDAPGWLASRFEQLVGDCGPTGTAPAAPVTTTTTTTTEPAAPAN